MHNNYERLFQELTELVDDSNVYESLDSNLKKRVDSIFFYNTKPSPDSTIKQFNNDVQNLFTKNNTNQSEPIHENMILKESTNTNHTKKRQISNVNSKIFSKKVEITPFNDKQTKNLKQKNRSLNKNENRKNSRQFIRYNLQLSKSKSKSKEKDKDKIKKSSGQLGYKKYLLQDQLQNNIDSIILNSKTSKQIKKTIDKNASKKVNKYSISIKTDKSQYISSQSKLKTMGNLCQSRQILKKLATIQTQNSRSSLSGNKINFSKQKYQPKNIEKQLTIMDAIQRRQQMLNVQKRQSQIEIKILQQQIQKEKNRLENIKLNIVKINAQISKNQIQERGCSQQIKISRKKSQHFISQSRQIENRISEVNKSKGTICASIEEEKYLVDMYLTVIQEIKSQLKIEQTQKIDLIKKLVILKNTEKMCMQKYLSKEALNDQIFRCMSDSMKKWI